MGISILVVDDEQDICDILKFNLETEGYHVTTANSAEEALSQMEDGEWKMDNLAECSSKPDTRHSTSNTLPDLILLDVMMGEMSGFQMARKLKDNPQTANIPVIFITALDDEDNTVEGLNIGADDYIAKPLSMKEVKARVKAVLRRTSPSSDPADINIVIDDDRKQLIVDGKEVLVTKIEYGLISLLYNNANHVFSRDELLKKCWPADTYVLDRTVDVNITRLRKKLGNYGKNIKTRFGYGYIFEK